MPGPVDDRVVGMSLDQLRAVPDVVAIAHGEDRAPAVRAVVRGRALHTLVCDTAVAARLLAGPPFPASEDAT